VAITWRFGWSSALPAYLALGATAAVVTVTDLTTRKIPEAVVVPSYPLAAALLAVASAPRGQWWALARGGIPMASLGGFYLVLGLAFPNQFGIGDPLTELRREPTFLGMPDFDPSGRRTTMKATLGS
jgi:leader peptidase (prepilin peptidase)/N-methyltransferase